MTLEEFIEIVQDGRIFTVDFTKKSNSEYRIMNCRWGVTKGTKGIITQEARHEEDMRHKVLTVYEMPILSFRRINLADMHTLKLNGKSYIWDNDNSVFVEI